MKLKTNLQVSAVFSIVLAIVLSVGLFLRSRPVSQARERLDASKAVIIRIAEIEASMYGYLLRKDAASQQRWQNTNDALEKFLAALNPGEFREKIILGRIRNGHQRVREVFAGMIALRQSAGTDSVKSLADHNAYKKMETELVEKLRDMISDAFDLASAGASDVVIAQQNADMVFAILVGILALVMAGATISASRSVVNRLSSLKEGTTLVAAGNLQHRFETRDHDEIGDLFRAFNEMIRRLQESDEALRKEAQERKRIADALRDGNMRLSDALSRLRQAQQQVIQQERLRALEQIARGVAHDFNNLLTPILGTSDFLLTFPKYLEDREELIAHLQTICNAAKEARNQVRRISDFFRPAAGEKAGAVNVNALVDNAVKFTEPRWLDTSKAEGIHIRCETNLQNIPLALGNKADIKEAVANLIMNAVEAMPKGGTIRLSTRPEGKWVVLDVSDTGEGMTDEVRRCCLEPFFSTKGSSGSGMGLTMVLSTVKRCGGTLDIETARGKGTTVRIRLPIYNEASAAAAEAKSLPSSARKLAVIVIDDEPWSCDIVSKTLAANGNVVETAANGRDGLQKLAAGQFDLVLLDRALPDMSGDEVAIEIKRIHPGLPIILFTGFGDVMQLEGVHPQGVDYILSKPVTMSELQDAVSKVIAPRGG